MSPSTLYKYLSPGRVDILQSLRVRFTQLSALNDPFESFPGVMIEERDWYLQKFRARVENEIAKLGITGDSKKKQYWRARKKEFPAFLSRYSDSKRLLALSETVQHMSDTVQGCLSLSATPTNILMCSHYAKHHTGYVLGFHANHEYFGKSVSAVTYASSRPPLNPFEDEHSGELFCTKSCDWSYEQEYRKFQSFVEPIKLSNGNTFLPAPESPSTTGANDSIVLFPIPRDSIACVILGWRSGPDLQKSIEKALDAHALSGVGLFKAIPSLTKYEMEVVPLYSAI